MPIYEYRCRECGKINEFLIGVVRDKIEIKCRHCGSGRLDKIFSKSFISIKGNSIASSQNETCCGRDEPCDIPPCSDDGVCKR